MTEPPAPGAPRNNRTLLLVLSYLWPLAFVPLLAETTDQEVRWHAKHGVVLLACEFGFWALTAFVAELLALDTLGLGFVVDATAPFIGFGFIVMHGLAIYQAVNGRRLFVPAVSEWADRL
jgi:hypothetical protein